MVLLNDMGYDTSYMVESNDRYFVGTENIFTKAMLMEYRLTPQPKLNYDKRIALECQQMHLNCFYSDFSNIDFIKDAVKEWNNLENCNIAFSTNLDNETIIYSYDVYFNIQEYANDKSLLRYTPSMIPGKPGTELQINVSHPLWPQLSRDQKKYLIMHGLGHIIGLSDYNDTMSGMFSIMLSERFLSEQNLNLWSGFSVGDKFDLEYLYPLMAPKTSFSMTPAAGGDEQNLLAIGQNYEITPEYSSIKLHKPTFVITTTKLDNTVAYTAKQTGNSLNIQFSSPGECKVTVSVRDEKNAEKHRFEKIYRAELGKPKFTYPTAIELGKFYTFKMVFENANYTQGSYTYSVKEVLFDNNTARSATIEQDGKGTARIRFNDYGKYYVTAKAVYGGKSAEFKFLYTHLYRPEPETFPMLVEPGPNFGSAGIPEFTTEPTGENLIGIYRMRIRFDKAALMPHRLVCQVTGDRRQQFWQSPGRVDYRIIDYCTEQRQVILTEADSAYVDLSDERSYFHPDSVNYKEHRTVIYPYATAKYTEKDWCGLVNTTYSNAE